MHISGQAGIELSGCGWHSTVLNNAITVAIEDGDLKLGKLLELQKALNKKTKSIRYIPSLNDIFGNTHLIQKKADNHIPFDYLCADCVRSYVELINYLLHRLRNKIKQKTIAGKTVFIFPITDYLFDDEQEKEIFFYLEKLRETLDDEELKTLVKELIEFNKAELIRYFGE